MGFVSIFDMVSKTYSKVWLYLPNFHRLMSKSKYSFEIVNE